MGNKNTAICNSKVKVVNKTFIWKIKNFSALPHKTGEFLRSPIFTSHSTDGHILKWKLRIYPNGDKEESAGHVSIFNEIIGSKIVNEVSAQAEYYLVDKNKVEKLQNQGGYCNYNKKNSTWGYTKFIKREELVNDGFLPRNRLTIVCKLAVREEMVEGNKKDVPVADIQIPECRALEDIGNLLEQSLFTDCTIIAGDGKEFKVHKGVLACRSPVFARMFENPMDEAKNGTVKIGDINSAAMEQMLKFIYSGLVVNMAETAEELLAAADKYELERLKILCERHLANSIGNENACKLLVLANRHSAKHLEAETIKYFKGHSNEIIESDGWKMLKENFGELIDEIVKGITSSK